MPETAKPTTPPPNDGRPTNDLWSRCLALSHRLKLSYYVIRWSIFLVTRLPTWLTHTVARGLGWLVFVSWVNHRHAITRNMRHALGPNASVAKIHRHARTAYVNYFSYLIDFLRTPYRDMGDIVAAVDASGFEHLDNALAHGRGAIMVTMHLGAFDVAGWMLVGRGYKINAVVETFHPPELNELIQGQRARQGMAIIPLEHSTRQILATLRRNEVLVLLIDRPVADGVEIDFLGSPTRVPGGPALLALRTGARIVPAIAVRQPGGRYLGWICPAPTIEPSGNHARDVQALTQLYMRALEDAVRRFPEQWYMFRPMWSHMTSKRENGPL